MNCIRGINTNMEIANFICVFIQSVSTLLSCYWIAKTFKSTNAQFRIDRITDIYRTFFECSPCDKLDQGFILFPKTAYILISELNVYNKTLMKCNNELRLLTFNDNSKEALNLRSAFSQAKIRYSTFYETLSLYINSEDYPRDINRIEKSVKCTFNITLTEQALVSNSSLRRFYAQNLESTEGIKNVSIALDNLKIALQDENFDIHFHNYLKKISS